MGIAYNNSIVRDGLVLHLDAANPKSYPGSGTTWFDLSYNPSDAFLVNGVSFLASDVNYFSFDGNDDYINFSIPNPGNIVTVEMWCRVNSFNGGMFFGWYAYDVWTGQSSNTGSIGFNTAQGDIYGLNPSSVSSLGVLNNWKHYVFEMRSDVSYTNNKIYINGENQVLTQVSGSESSSNRNFNNGNGRIGVWIINNNFNLNMSCSVFKAYNRSLSEAEIKQNFNSMRDRYGI